MLALHEPVEPLEEAQIVGRRVMIDPAQGTLPLPASK
jgi:hypothetical protein